MYATQRRYFTNAAGNHFAAQIAHAQLRTVAQAPRTTRALAPESDVADVLRDISHPALRQFLDKVLHEPLIHGLVTLPLVGEGQPLQFPVQHLRRTASTFSSTQSRTRQEKDLILVATVLWGIRSLLPLSIYGDSDLQDVFCTLIRPALHGLDDDTYEVSAVLRGLVGMGDEAAGQGEFIAAMTSRIQRAVQDMHRSKPGLISSMRKAIERKTGQGVRDFVQRACQ